MAAQARCGLLASLRDRLDAVSPGIPRHLPLAGAAQIPRMLGRENYAALSPLARLPAFQGSFPGYQLIPNPARCGATTALR